VTNNVNGAHVYPRGDYRVSPPTTRAEIVKKDDPDSQGTGSWVIFILCSRHRRCGHECFPDDDHRIVHFRDGALDVNKEYYGIRVLLRDAREELGGDPRNEDLAARVRFLAWRLKDLEEQFPWLLAEVPSGKGSLCGAWQGVIDTGGRDRANPAHER
jgi:hypothetical protein